MSKPELQNLSAAPAVREAWTTPSLILDLEVRDTAKSVSPGFPHEAHYATTTDVTTS